MSLLVQQETLTNRNFEIIQTGLVSVTRSASTDGGYTDVLTSVLEAPMFLCEAFVPGSSPAFVQQVPKINYSTVTGYVTGGLRCLYDPSTGVIRCFVDATAISGTYGSDESWTFRYYLLRESGK